MAPAARQRWRRQRGAGSEADMAPTSAAAGAVPLTRNTRRAHARRTRGHARPPGMRSSARARRRRVARSRARAFLRAPVLSPQHQLAHRRAELVAVQAPRPVRVQHLRAWVARRQVPTRARLGGVGLGLRGPKGAGEYRRCACARAPAQATPWNLCALVSSHARPPAFAGAGGRCMRGTPARDGASETQGSAWSNGVVDWSS